ncbi:unnamed protein product [Calypogeia fissa]
MGSLGCRPHALVIALPHKGHWHPMKIFIRQLASMHISITVLGTPDEVSELQQLKDDGVFDSAHYVELVAAWSNPPKMRVLKSLETLTMMKQEFWAKPALKERLLAQIAASSGPTFLVADMFLYWTQDLADQLGIPRYTFFTSPTTFALLMLHVPELLAYDPSVTEKPDVVVNLQGMEVFRASDICTAVFEFPETYRLHSKYIRKAAGILINCWESYEVAEVAALHSCLKKVVGDAKVPSIHLIGPLQYLPVNRVVEDKKEVTVETDSSGCLRFLDTQTTSSVLYICFGSVAELDEASITELARGLELSEVPFLWILPRPDRFRTVPTFDVAQFLPQGFLLRTKGRGLVCSNWAPQPAILAHSSVGGFISHCGWNSLVESLINGIAVIPWPYWAEQHMNARIVVDVAKVGIRIQRTPDGHIVAEGIAMAVRTLFCSDEGTETKQRMQELKRTVEIAVGEGGSSLKALEAFHAEVSSLGD